MSANQSKKTPIAPILAICGTALGIVLMIAFWGLVNLNSSGYYNEPSPSLEDMQRSNQESMRGVRRVDRLTWDHQGNRRRLDSLSPGQRDVDFVTLDIIANPDGESNWDMVVEMRRKGYWIPDDYVVR